jgi:hypothetical protein
MQDSKKYHRDFDSFEEPNCRALRLSTPLREFLRELKIRNLDTIQEIIEDRKRIQKVFSGWKRRKSGKIYIFRAKFSNIFF